ncbi:PREDICTED: transcription elongation factor A protein-like 8 [Myotis brandtii]|uniref:transcription elongation factor A protein-like 8 n=1 Tax=Myotis brandtii TaxID=109478 RepID=UPI0003BB7037|nr:PREDICTED: transcription elongation factor A protein-like 8 [Myotis brandtii]
MQKSCEENEGKAQNMPKHANDRPSEEVPQEAEGNPQPSEEGVSQKQKEALDRLTRPVWGFKEDTPVRHLNSGEMLRGVNELERLREEIRVRNKFMVMHWPQRHSHSDPYPEYFNLVTQHLRASCTYLSLGFHFHHDDAALEGLGHIFHKLVEQKHEEPSFS